MSTSCTLYSFFKSYWLSTYTPNQLINAIIIHHSHSQECEYLCLESRSPLPSAHPTFDQVMAMPGLSCRWNE
jgi:hypothetical protein